MTPNIETAEMKLPAPRLALTLGDPAGIGPEVILKALSKLTKLDEITVVGSRQILQQTYQQLRASTITMQKAIDPEQLQMIDIDIDVDKITPGMGNAASGAASFAYLETAIAHTLAGEFDAIVTGPIAKHCWKAAGHHYPGQTELLAERAGVNRFGMLFVAKSPHSGWTMRTLLATTHIPLRQVPDTLNPDLLSRKLDLFVECLEQNFGIQTPKIAISGLNPHSGENGQLGTEEKDWLIPWLEEMRDRYPHVQLDGPIPPDTLWVKPAQTWFGTGNYGHDGYLALYHDQGLIPVKLMAFDRAVNTTIGLPFLRTSPDHGTGFDIAGKGLANGASMKAALELAMDIVPHNSAAQKKG
ncbi:4-hydroxythreonine-4-phosphate dehydrogenase PdxA [Planktothricoides raciborskii]|uniref:4-hydroxythreonine-4-phosphate dehydrogenase n=1 Tax=Planktothricoides raciborskii GIHE-MW2 TaxID=2792601 RepID=A0AAU8J8T1_9CYAN